MLRSSLLCDPLSHLLLIVKLVMRCSFRLESAYRTSLTEMASWMLVMALIRALTSRSLSIQLILPHTTSNSLASPACNAPSRNRLRIVRSPHFSPLATARQLTAPAYAAALG